MRRVLELALVALLVAQGRAQEPLLGAPLLAYTRADHADVWLYDVQADTARRLRLGEGLHHVWGFSPDGCRLLASLDAGRLGGRLFSLSLDGTDVRSLVAYDELPPQAWGVWEATWSPDGQRIAFIMLREQPERGQVVVARHLAIIPSEGGAPQFYSVTGREHSPAWSPDGALLAYTSYDERPVGADPLSTAAPTLVPEAGVSPSPPVTVSEADLWLIRADGQAKTRLTNFSVGSVTMPRWSPDGALLGFVYSPTPNNDLFWMIAPQANAIPTQLSLGGVNVLDLAWLPDSTALLASARNMQGISENILWRVPLVGLADTDSAPLLPEAAGLGSADFPRWSADGRILALRSAYALALWDAESQQARFIADSLGNTPPHWSPAGFQGETGCRP
ncbi:MAG: hypothetical protein NZ750_07765 [Anaerolineae bacterium]|nr:hypothetical protein [Anaerolineae bacterium]MDW8172246.1 hypothetical protein [Anaerolineae bacterium]